jgi:hypothetical protein
VLHPQHRSLLAILILSIFVAVNVREIVVVFVSLRLDRLRLKCRRTNQDLADLFLFSPNIHGFIHFVPLPLVIPGVIEFTFLCLDVETRKESAF